jgi:hypothetical protein
VTEELPGVIDLADGVTALRRGARLTGVVRLREEHLHGATLAVEWYTEGKGTRDSRQIAEVALSELTARGSTEGWLELPFSIRLPVWPVTYHGVLLKIHWRAVLSLRASGWTETRREQPFEVVA